MIPTRQEPLWILHKENEITLLEIKLNIYAREKKKRKKVENGPVLVFIFSLPRNKD